MSNHSSDVTPVVYELVVDGRPIRVTSKRQRDEVLSDHSNSVQQLVAADKRQFVENEVTHA
jgi:CRISPR/Cas system-associated exonuclease Cas4 (RecB family)